MKNKIKTDQSGFTLVELIVVIIILAILGAVALPKFIDVTDKAQVSAVKGAGGGLGAGVALFHAQWVANGHTGVEANVAGFGQDDVDSNIDGWPVGTGGNSSLADAADCIEIWNGVMQGPPTITSGAVTNQEYRATAASTTCTYTYHGGQATAPNHDVNGDDTVGDPEVMTITYDTSNGNVVVSAP